MTSETVRARQESDRPEITVKVTYHPAQDRIFFRSATRNKVIVKGRRFGLTRGFAQYAIESMLDGVSPILWVDTVNTNIARYVDRYFIPVLRQIPANVWDWRSSKKELRIGESVCDLRSADIPENIEGFGYKLIILNEAGIILKDEYLWHNTLRPMMIDFNSPILAGGTPKGKNLFYRLYNKGLADEADWESFHFTTYDNPFLRKEDVDNIAKDMPDLVRRQEIMAEFLEDEAAVFRGVEACVGGELADPEPGRSYVAGLDLAKHADWTVLAIMDEETRHVVWFGRMQKRDWPYQKDWIEGHVRRYNRAKVCIDATAIGDVVADDLKNRGLHVVPFVFTARDKRQLIEGLALDIEQRAISYPAIPELLKELKLFEIEVSSTGNFRYNAPEGFHDDCVISLALAAWGTRRVATPGFFFV